MKSAWLSEYWLTSDSKGKNLSNVSSQPFSDILRYVEKTDTQLLADETIANFPGSYFEVFQQFLSVHSNVCREFWKVLVRTSNVEKIQCR